MKRNVLLIAILICCLQFCHAQPGELDPTFGNNGIITPSGNQGISSIAVQADGKILVAGQNLARYNSDGSPDNSFGNGGIIIIKVPFIVNIAIQRDGKIVAASEGNSGITLSRYNTDGSLDKTLDFDGIKTTDIGYDEGEGANAIPLVIQDDNKIVAASASGITRFNTDGSTDMIGKSIGAGFSMSSIALQSDGKIVFAAIGFGIFTVGRYNTDGTLDNTFNSDGIQNAAPGLSSPSSYAVAIQGDGKIVAAGMSNNYHNFVVIRYNKNGSLDNTFSNDGVQTAEFGFYSSAFSIAIQNDDKIVLGGRFSNNKPDGGNNYYFALARFNTDGSPDNSFSDDGKQTTEIKGCWISANVVIANNKLYAAGTSANSLPRIGVLARYELFTGKETTVRISSPPDTSYTAPATINIIAVANAPKRTIKKVEFYNGSTLLFRDSVSPYTFKWEGVPEGTYELTAKATDDSGNVATSGVVSISVLPDLSPTIKITSPTDGADYVDQAMIILSAEVNNYTNKIKRVEFYSGGTLIGTEENPPFYRSWKNVHEGRYSITAKAIFYNGATLISAPVHITVLHNDPPAVTITSPAAGTVFTAPASIFLSANASDADGIVKRVNFYNGTTLLTIERKFPYTYQWQDVPAGTYTISALATDDHQLQHRSAPVSITVLSPKNAGRSSLPADKIEIDNAFNLQLEPNPAHNILNIYPKGLHLGKQSTISIISASGVMMRTIQITGSTQTKQLDVSLLASGIYFIKMVSGEKVTYRQFVKL